MPYTDLHVESNKPLTNLDLNLEHPTPPYPSLLGITLILFITSGSKADVG